MNIYIPAPREKLPPKIATHAKTNQTKIPTDPDSHNPILCRKGQFVRVIKKEIYTKESQMPELSVLTQAQYSSS